MFSEKVNTYFLLIFLSKVFQEAITDQELLSWSGIYCEHGVYSFFWKTRVSKPWGIKQHARSSVWSFQLVETYLKKGWINS